MFELKTACRTRGDVQWTKDLDFIAKGLVTASAYLDRFGRTIALPTYLKYIRVPHDGLCMATERAVVEDMFPDEILADPWAASQRCIVANLN